MANMLTLWLPFELLILSRQWYVCSRARLFCLQVRPIQKLNDIGEIEVDDKKAKSLDQESSGVRELFGV